MTLFSTYYLPQVATCVEFVKIYCNELANLNTLIQRARKKSNVLSN